ncbi:MAG: hypothetical protein EA388_08075 [Nitriliruptor sp.]|nr:MAG: hypothetical protein EA388_08075 [Nitriliruptor sp.]
MPLTASRTAALTARHATIASEVVSELLDAVQTADAAEVVPVGPIRELLALLESHLGECLHHLGSLLEHDRLATLGSRDTSPKAVSLKLSEDEVALLLVLLEANWLQRSGEADALSRDARRLHLRLRAAADTA